MSTLDWSRREGRLRRAWRSARVLGPESAARLTREITDASLAKGAVAPA